MRQCHNRRTDLFLFFSTFFDVRKIKDNGRRWKQRESIHEQQRDILLFLAVLGLCSCFPTPYCIYVPAFFFHPLIGIFLLMALSFLALQLSAQILPFFKHLFSVKFRVQWSIQRQPVNGDHSFSELPFY